MSEIPFKLTHFNLFVDGKGFAGLIKEMTLPKITFKIEDHMSGGMDAPAPVEMGMEKLEATFTLASYEPEVFRLLGFRAGGPIAIIARGSLKRDDEVIAMTVTMRGVIKEIDMGNWKKGEDTQLQFSLHAQYYRLDRGVENLVEIDVKNLIRRFGGVDQLEAVRAALLLN